MTIDVKSRMRIIHDSDALEAAARDTAKQWGYDRCVALTKEYAAAYSAYTPPFHRANCPRVRRMKAINTTSYSTIKAALAHGHRPCMVCKPGDKSSAGRWPGKTRPYIISDPCIYGRTTLYFAHVGLFRSAMLAFANEEIES